jgi:hypothetical protein
MRPEYYERMRWRWILESMRSASTDLAGNAKTEVEDGGDERGPGIFSLEMSGMGYRQEH